MSILIKGMDAPNHPQKITIEFINERQVITSVGNFEYCEIPTPHGRIVDIDAEVEKHNRVPILGEHLRLMAKHMTTVIESEK